MMASDISRVTIRPVENQQTSSVSQRRATSSQAETENRVGELNNEEDRVDISNLAPVRENEAAGSAQTSSAEEERANLVALTTRLQIEQQQSVPLGADSQGILSFFR